jgi:hypothetical protein
MFDEALTIKTKDGEVTQKPFEMLQPIKKAKYPAVSEVRYGSIKQVSFLIDEIG